MSRCLFCDLNNVKCECECICPIEYCIQPENHICEDCILQIRKKIKSMDNIHLYKCNHIIEKRGYLMHLNPIITRKFSNKSEWMTIRCRACRVCIKELLLEYEFRKSLQEKCCDVVVKNPELLIETVEVHRNRTDIWKMMNIASVKAEITPKEHKTILDTNYDMYETLLTVLSKLISK